MAERKISTRTCVGCGESGDKREFVRVVRTPEGHVEVDRSGKANGRGAYLHAQTRCFESARKKRRIGSALKVNLKDDDYDRLRRDFESVCGEVDDRD